jgi:shikimate kinase
VVFLQTSVRQQLDRTRQGRHRPLLMTGDPQARLAELMEQRAHLYSEIADITVSTDGRRVQAVAEDVQKLLSERPAPT